MQLKSCSISILISIIVDVDSFGSISPAACYTEYKYPTSFRGSRIAVE